MAAQRRPPQAPGRGALQSATGGGYRINPTKPMPNAAPLLPGTDTRNTGPGLPPMAGGQPPQAGGGMPLPRALRQRVEAGAIDPQEAFQRAFQNRAGFRERAMQAVGQGPPPAQTAPANMIGGGPMRAEDAAALRAANPNPFGSVGMQFQDNGPVMPPLKLRTGGGLQAPGGDPSSSNPANQPPGIDGAIANLRSQLGMTQAGGAAPSGADPMSMIARLRGNAQMAQANGYPAGGAGGSGGPSQGLQNEFQANGARYLAGGGGPQSGPGQPGKGSAPMSDFQGLRGQFGPAMQAGAQGAQFGGIPPQLAGNLPPGAAGMTKPFFGDISQMTGQAAGPSGLSGLPAIGMGLGANAGNPYLGLLRNRLGA